MRSSRGGRGQIAVARSIPAPIGGWNSMDALSSMPKSDALILDNMIPRGGQLELRRGFIEQCTGTAAAVETLVTYQGSSSGDKLFAATGAYFYDVTTAGALPAAAYSSAASARWNYTNFSNDAGRFAILCNGAQQPIKYNGSAFSTSSFTYSGTVSFDQTKLKYVFGHKARLHFLEKDSLHVWFGGLNAISGAVGLLDLGPIFSKGGVLVGGARLTLDGGVGPDDFAVYVTNKGQVALYQGLDPSDPNNWSLVGVFSLPKPIGDRCLIDNGTDLLLITEAGVLPLTAALKTPNALQADMALSSKIMSVISDSAASYGSNFGWQPVLYPGRGGLLILNVPTAELSTSQQYVRAMDGGAWCRFTGINAFCWGQANGQIYFGSTLGVYRWDAGASDNGVPIVADILPAFQDFGNRTVTKNFTMVRALIRAPAIVKPALQVVTDFDKNTIPTAIQSVVTPGDISPDDSSLIRDDWTGATGTGYYGSPRMRISLTGSANVDRVAVTSDHTSLLLVGPGGTDHILTRPNLPLDVTVQLVGFDLMFCAGGQL